MGTLYSLVILNLMTTQIQKIFENAQDIQKVVTLAWDICTVKLVDAGYRKPVSTKTKTGEGSIKTQ